MFISLKNSLSVSETIACLIIIVIIVVLTRSMTSAKSLLNNYCIINHYQLTK